MKHASIRVVEFSVAIHDTLPVCRQATPKDRCPAGHVRAINNDVVAREVHDPIYGFHGPIRDTIVDGVIVITLLRQYKTKVSAKPHLHRGRYACWR